MWRWDPTDALVSCFRNESPELELLCRHESFAATADAVGFMPPGDLGSRKPDARDEWRVWWLTS